MRTPRRRDRRRPGYVGEIDELLGPERLRDALRDRVGVDVVRLTCLVDADGRHDRDELLTDETFEDRRIDAANVADEAELLVPGRNVDESGVLARETDGVRAVPVDRRERSRG
jgi:hypothetical protein